MRACTNRERHNNTPFQNMAVILKAFCGQQAVNKQGKKGSSLVDFLASSVVVVVVVIVPVADGLLPFSLMP